MQRLVVMSGLPGTGKSAVAEALLLVLDPVEPLQDIVAAALRFQRARN
jgi:predicted kinase